MLDLGDAEADHALVVPERRVHCRNVVPDQCALVGLEGGADFGDDSSRVRNGFRPGASGDRRHESEQRCVVGCVERDEPLDEQPRSHRGELRPHHRRT